VNKLEAYGKLSGGRLILHNEKRFKQDLKELPDQEVILTIKKRGKTTTPQRGYYFSVIVQEIRLRFRDLGHRMDNEETHEFLKLKFNPRHICDEHGEVIGTTPGSTTEFNVSEMADYMDRIIEWAATTIDCHIPPADKSLSMF
jgi:hypothetical protein